jgi:type IV secretion system protein VirD4
MRWTTILLSILLLCLAATLWVFASPFVTAILAAHQHARWSTAVLHTLLNSRNPNPTTQPITWILFILMGIAVLVARVHITLPKRTTYGSSHYATWRETWPYLKRRLHWPRLRPRRAKAPAIPSESLFVIGTYRWRTIALSEKRQEEHVLVTGPNGAGKSSWLLIPNLLRERGNRSLFIADLKNELFPVTAGAVARFHEVWLFAPTRPHESHAYNPLAHIRSAADANLFARCWVKNTE